MLSTSSFSVYGKSMGIGNQGNEMRGQSEYSSPVRSVPLLGITLALSEAMDLINPVVVNHQMKVAYIASSLAAVMGLSAEEQSDIICAGLLHDSGAFSLRERIEALEFEIANPHIHAETGYRLLRSFGPLSTAASLIRHHHAHWNDGSGSDDWGIPVPLGSHILHLADRVSVLAGAQSGIPPQTKDAALQIREHCGSMFMPEVVEAFLGLAAQSSFWIDCNSSSIQSTFWQKASATMVTLDWRGIQDLSGLFCRLIDFRSRWTATHSRTVAACSDVLAKLMGFSDPRRRMLKIAGCLHDLGKLAVPLEILEKPSRLSREEFEIVKLHPLYTYSVLARISGFEEVRYWAALHHESPDGTGYPLGSQCPSLPLESRVLAVTDVFSALSENRPYRPNMTAREILWTMRDMAKHAHLDRDLVGLLAGNFDEIESARAMAQSSAMEEYRADFTGERTN